MATDFRTAPGVYTGGTLTTRNIFTTQSLAQYVPSLALLDGSLSRDTGSTPVDLLRAGVLLGKVTASGKYRPSIIGLTNGAIGAGAATSITVPAAVATEVARLIAVAAGNVSLNLIGPPTAGGTVATTAVTATAASGTTITISSATLPAYVDKSLITPADGSQIPVTVLANQAGIDVQDTLGNSVDQLMGQFLRGADLIASQIVAGANALTDLDASTQKWIKQQINGGGTTIKGDFTFDSDR